MVQMDSTAVDMVNQTARGTDNNLHIVAQRTDLAFNRLGRRKQAVHARGGYGRFCLLLPQPE